MWLSESVKVKNPKSVWWNDEVKTTVKRKEESWKEVLGDKDEDAKQRCLEVWKEKEEEKKRG